MDCSDLVARLEVVPELRLQAIALVLDVTARGDVSDMALWDMAEISTVIGPAIEELGDQAEKAGRMAKRCRHLRPIPSKTLPPGF